MTTHDCNTCANYKPSDRYWDSDGAHATKQPEIIPLSKEQCEWLSKNGFRKPGYHRELYSNEWVHDLHCHWIMSRIYGLPSDDPFWKEWEEMQNACQYKNKCSRWEPNDDGKCIHGSSTYSSMHLACFRKKPLVRVWSIDKSGGILREYDFSGQPDWERIKQENEGAEAIVVWSEGDIKSETGMLFSNGLASYLYISPDGFHYHWLTNNPVESIRAKIKKRNAPKFKENDIVKADGILWMVAKPAPKVSQYSVFVRSLDGTRTHSYPESALNFATRSDFIVKRKGSDGVEHEWLAVAGNGEYGAIGGWWGKGDHVDLSVDGKIYTYRLCDWLVFNTMFNLPVCPAEVK